MKINPSLYLVVALCLSCGDNDPQPGTYSKEWTLDLGNYVNSTYSITGFTFEAVMLENGRVLINEYSDTENHLVEIDPEKGSFETQTKQNPGFISDLRKRRNGKILVASYNRVTGFYSMGFYNEDTHAVDFFSSFDSQLVNDSESLRRIYAGDDFIYTHNTNIAPLGMEDVYLAKWDLNGSLTWREIFDPTKQAKIASIETVHDDHVLIQTVSYINEVEKWQVAKVSADGTTLWHKEMNEYGDLFRVRENDQGDIFVLNDRAVSKHDQDGNELWATSLENLPSGFVWASPLPTADGGILFHFESQDIILIKINASGQVVWQERYWEKNEDTGGIGFMELPDGDLIVTSLSGFVTKYQSH